MRLTLAQPARFIDARAKPDRRRAEPVTASVVRGSPSCQRTTSLPEQAFAEPPIASPWPSDLGSPKAPHQLAPPRRHDSSPSGAFVRVGMATFRHLIPSRLPWRRRQDRHRRPDAEAPSSLVIAKADARGSRTRADGSAGAQNPGTSWEASSEMKEASTTGGLAASEDRTPAEAA